MTCLLGFLSPLLLLKMMFIHSYFLCPLRQPGQSILPGAEPHDPQGGSCLHMAASSSETLDLLSYSYAAWASDLAQLTCFFIHEVGTLTTSCDIQRDKII